MSFQHTFSSGWGFSIIELSSGHEIAVMKDGEWHFNNPIGTFGYLTKEEVSGFINSIEKWKSDETFDDGWDDEELFSLFDSIMERWDEEDE